MTNKEASERLISLGKDRPWLTAATGYSIHSLNNAFSGEERPLNERMEKAFERAFSEEERRREVNTEKPGASVWDLVFFSGREMDQIDRAKKNAGYKDLPSFYRDAVIDFADRLLAEETLPPGNVTPISSPALSVDFRGGIAAGAVIATDVSEETIPIQKDYPLDHYALKVFGRSMEPKIPDGSTIIVREYVDKGYPKQGTIVVYSDRLGRALKVFGYRKVRVGEDGNPFGKVPVLKSINSEFPDTELIDGGRIEAVYVETL